MKCDQCGYENADVNNFCEECGNKLVKEKEEGIIKNDASQVANVGKANQIEICIMEDGELVIQDLDSEHGVCLNGEVLDTINLYALLDGDCVETSDTRIKIRVLTQIL
ncbi:zinc-ribbon domain-containing protein [Acetobacterium wieringae]|uniref:zinc-ribbon domain-containing protein n=1 Tax=Acetobacterium wieringae TaxID=52694 RepID=UPI003158A6A2